MRHLAALHPSALKRSGFAGTKMKRGLNCFRKWLLCGDRIHEVMESAKGCVPQKQLHIGVKIPIFLQLKYLFFYNSGSTKSGNS